MASIITILIKGVSKPELEKNFQIVDSYMNSNQTSFTLVSNTRPNYNPRIYYNKDTVNSKDIHDITNVLKTDKIISHAVRAVEYAGHLNKV
jgi:hypothetical protein